MGVGKEWETATEKEHSSSKFQHILLKLDVPTHCPLKDAHRVFI